MSFNINEKQLRIRYIRDVEKFLTRTIALLKLENFDKELFIKRTVKNHEDMCKTPKVDLYSDYYTGLNNFIEKTILKNSNREITSLGAKNSLFRVKLTSEKNAKYYKIKDLKVSYKKKEIYTKQDFIKITM